MNTRKRTVSIHKQPETVEVKQLSIKYKFTFVVQFIPFPQHASVKFSHLDDFVEYRFGYWHSTMWCSKWGGLLANVNEVVIQVAFVRMVICQRRAKGRLDISLLLLRLKIILKHILYLCISTSFRNFLYLMYRIVSCCIYVLAFH